MLLIEKNPLEHEHANLAWFYQLPKGHFRQAKLDESAKLS
jgi:hypothetical protein